MPGLSRIPAPARRVAGAPGRYYGSAATQPKGRIFSAVSTGLSSSETHPPRAHPSNAAAEANGAEDGAALSAAYRDSAVATGEVWESPLEPSMISHALTFEEKMQVIKEYYDARPVKNGRKRCHYIAPPVCLLTITKEANI